MAGWSSTPVETDWLFLGKVGMRQVVNRDYTKRGRRVSMFVGLGASELRFQSVLSPKTGVPGRGWMVEEEGEIELRGRPVTYRVARKGTRRLLVHHWYEGLGGVVSESLRVMSGIDGSKFRRDRNTLVVRLATPIGRSQNSRREGEARLLEFSKLLQSPLKQIAVPSGD
jgi:EpsI family protein